MPEGENLSRYLRAVEDFRTARRRARRERFLSALRRQPDDLLSYEAVRAQLRAVETAQRALEDIPIDRIVGSVNRYTDFSRRFFPLNESDQQRWARVRARIDSMEGLPPIEAYRIGDLYFVLDGNHRVSVTREIGAKTIQGYVTTVTSRVPLAAGDLPDDLIIKSEYTDFLNDTEMDAQRPEANLLVSAPGQYPRLMEQIRVHQYFMGIEQNREVSITEAAPDWFDSVYLPVVGLIRSRSLLDAFPQRTEADLYLWITEHRAALGNHQLGWEAPVEKVITDLQERYSSAPGQRRRRAARAFLESITPRILRGGPPPGAWRSAHESHRADRLFGDILVTLTTQPGERAALALAVEIAQREEARLTAIHLHEESETDPQHQALVDQFYRLCAENGVRGRVVMENGPPVERLCSHARWVDLTIFRLAHPPPQPMPERLRSGVRELIRCSSVPLVAVSESSAPLRLDSALLCVGPGRTAEEALYMAAYLAGKWGTALTVVSVEKPATPVHSPTPLQKARNYLETQGIQAAYIEEQVDQPAAAVLVSAERIDAGFLIIGSYEGPNLRESLLDSTIDMILRSTRRPVFICK